MTSTRLPFICHRIASILRVYISVNQTEFYLKIGTDGPGFTVDGDAIETLGEKLFLPPFLENRRVEIEKNLKPIEEY